MTSGRRVVITGVSSHWGSELGAPARARPRGRVHRRDRHRAPAGRSRADRLHRGGHPQPGPLPAAAGDRGRHRRPLRDPLVPASRASPRGSLHDINVIGTLQLLAACERTDDAGARRRPRLGGDLRMRGGGAVASSPRTWPGGCRCGPASSATSPSSRATSRTSPAATRSRAAACCAISRRSAPDLDTPLVRYLSLPVVPTQLGFDPRLQLIHADDATGALEAAVRNPVRGAVNVAPVGLDLAEPDPAPRAAAVVADPAPAVRPGARAARRAARRRPALRRCGPPPALRPRRRQPPAAATRSATSPAFDALGRGQRLRVEGGLAARSGPGSIPASWIGQAAGTGRDGGAARRAPGSPPRRVEAMPWPTSSASMRHGVEDGLDPLAAAQTAVGDLPRALGTTVERLLRRMRGEYHEDEWGFDEEFAEAVFPLFEFLYDVWWRVEADGRRQRAGARARAAGRRTTPGSLFPFDASMMTSGDHEGAPAAALAALHGPRLGVRAAVPLLIHAPGGRRPREPPQRRARCSSRTSS